MIIFNWLCILIVAILLSTRYRGTKWFVFFCGVILLLLSYVQVGTTLVLGAILAFVYSIIPFGRNRLQKTYVVVINRMKKFYLSNADIKAKIREVMKLIKDTKIDDSNFSDTENILNLIQEMSKLDRDFLSQEQISIIRKKTAELWTQYYRLGGHKTHKNKIRTPYDILGIDCNATKEEIRRAYLKLCKLYHPDINHSKDAVIKFKEIQEAYDILCTQE